LDLQLPVHVQSVLITTKVVSSNPLHGEAYSIQHYVIKFVSELRQIGGFFPGTPLSSTNKTDHHDITEILLKMGINTIDQTKPRRILLGQAMIFLSWFYMKYK